MGALSRIFSAILVMCLSQTHSFGVGLPFSFWETISIPPSTVPTDFIMVPQAGTSGTMWLTNGGVAGSGQFLPGMMSGNFAAAEPRNATALSDKFATNLFWPPPHWAVDRLGEMPINTTGLSLFELLHTPANPVDIDLPGNLVADKETSMVLYINLGGFGADSLDIWYDDTDEGGQIINVDNPSYVAFRTHTFNGSGSLFGPDIVIANVSTNIVTMYGDLDTEASYLYAWEYNTGYFEGSSTAGLLGATLFNGSELGVPIEDTQGFAIIPYIKSGYNDRATAEGFWLPSDYGQPVLNILQTNKDAFQIQFTAKAATAMTLSCDGGGGQTNITALSSFTNYNDFALTNGHTYTYSAWSHFGLQGLSATSNGPTVVAVPCDDAPYLPLVWYKCNDPGDLPDLQDSSGNNLSGTAVGSPSFAIGYDGIANHALALNGTSQWVTTPNQQQPQTAFSWSEWINLNNAAATQYISVGSDGTGYYMQFFLVSGQLHARMAEGTFSVANYIGRATTTTLSSSVWTQVGFTWSGSTVSSSIVIYVNGAVQSTTDDSGGSFTAPSSSGNVSIGIGADIVGNAPSAGLFSDMREFPVCLTTAEMVNIVQVKPISN